MARKSKYSSTEIATNKKSATLLAGVYTRLSIEDNDDEEQNSIGNQKKIVLDYLKNHPDIVVTEFYVDNGYTGMNFNRPDFFRMMKDLRAGEISCVIVKDISRLGRNFVLTGEYVEKIFPMLGVRLICINDDYDSGSEKSDTAALLLPIKMVMNDNYVKDISRKIRSSISAKMMQGTYLPSSGSIPYGYIRNPDENTFDIDEEVSPVIQRIFTMKADNCSLVSICKVLNDDGIPCPGKLRFVRGITSAEKYKDSVWTHGTVRSIILNEVYIGNRIHGTIKRDKVGAKKARRSKDEWQVIENAHPPIITKELFEKANLSLKRTSEKREDFCKHEAPQEDYREILRDKLYCGDCGHPMRSCKGLSRADKEGKKKAFVYYNCGKYIQSEKKLCETHYIREETIISALRNALDQQFKIAIDLEQLIREIRAMPKVSYHNEAKSKELLSIQAKRRNLELKREQLIIDLTDGTVDKEEYTYAKNRYSEMIERLSEEETETLSQMNEFDNLIYGSDRWIRTLKECYALPKIDRKAVEYLVDRILIYRDKRIKILLRYNDPYKSLLQYVDRIEEMSDDK